MAYEEDDLTSRAREYDTTQIAIGHVDGVYDKGNPAGSPGERHTLVYVTLGGKNKTKSPGGRKLVCALSSLAGGRIPKDGTRVVVAIPQGMEESPGAPVIIATVEDDPVRLEADRRVFDYGDEHVIIRGKSVVLESLEGEFVAVGAPRSGGVSGVTIQAKDGSGAVWQVGVASMFVASDGDAKSVIQLTPAAVEIMQKDAGLIRLKDGKLVTLSNGETTMVCAKFGAGPNPATYVPVLVGPTGIAGVASVMVSFGGLA